MNLMRVFAVLVRQFFLYKSNPTRLIGIFLWLIIDMIQWGFITKYLGTFGGATFGFVTVILGAIILWGFMTRLQQGIMMAFLEDIWTQNFINFFASPLRVREYLSGLVLTSLCSSMAGIIAMIVIAWAVFGYAFFAIGVMLVPFLIILLVFGIAMGVFISGVVFKLGPSAEWLGWPIPLVLSLFAGVYYPIATLPEPLRIIAAIVPPSYVFESFREILSTGSFPPGLGQNLCIGGGLAIVYLVGASCFFVMIYKKNLVSGSISKFNAEAL
jgi:ABC-2 type transport system permease protein